MNDLRERTTQEMVDLMVDLINDLPTIVAEDVSAQLLARAAPVGEAVGDAVTERVAGYEERIERIQECASEVRELFDELRLVMSRQDFDLSAGDELVLGEMARGVRQLVETAESLEEVLQ